MSLSLTLIPDPDPNPNPSPNPIPNHGSRLVSYAAIMHGCSLLSALPAITHEMAQRLDSNPNLTLTLTITLALTLTTDPNPDPDPNQAQRLDAADETVSEEILRTVGNLARYALSAQSTSRSSMAKVAH